MPPREMSLISACIGYDTPVCLTDADPLHWYRGCHRFSPGNCPELRTGARELRSRLASNVRSGVSSGRMTPHSALPGAILRMLACPAMALLGAPIQNTWNLAFTAPR